MFSQKSSLTALVVLGLFFSSGIITHAQTKIRVGVFDSRAVAVAYYQSKFFNPQQIFGSLQTKMKAAKEKDDKKEIASIEREGTLRQAVMHEQGFGRGSINNITETVKNKIAQLAKEENLSVVVSKWELVFSGDDVVPVDVTKKIVDFFEPSEKVKSIVEEVIKSEPVKDAYLIED